MTQEDKQLLLKDLCARLPYHTNIRVFNPDGFEGYQTGEFDTFLCTHHIEPFRMDRFETIKPYLRSMSSMTEKEECIYLKLRAHALPFSIVEWLDKNHFDHRTNKDGEHLIEIGLALEAKKGMYKTE